MISQRAEKKRFTLGKADKIALAVIAGMVLVTIILSVIQAAGLTLINGVLALQLPLLALLVLVGWGLSLLIRRINNRVAKLVVISLVVIIAMLLVTVLFTYVNFMSSLTIAQRYATRNSPSGARKIVVMRVLDPDEERIEARRQARLAEDPDSDPEITIEDYGYIYRAYPRVLNFFYKNKADVEGEVYLAYTDGLLPKEEAPAEPEATEAEAVEAAEETVEAAAEDVAEATEEAADAAEEAVEEAVGAATATAQPEATQAPASNEGRRAVLSHGQLMIEWLDDENTVHLYVDQPGTEEGGDCYLRFGTK